MLYFSTALFDQGFTVHSVERRRYFRSAMELLSNAGIRFGSLHNHACNPIRGYLTNVGTLLPCTEVLYM